MCLEAALFEFTPEQKSLLEALSRETGRSIPALICASVESLVRDVCQVALVSCAGMKTQHMLHDTDDQVRL